MVVLDDTRMRIFSALVKAKRVMTQGELARALKIPAQKIYYHLPFLEASGLVIRDDHQYFCQPIFLDRGVRTMCADRLVEMVNAIESSDIGIVDVGQGLSREELLTACLWAMVALEIPVAVDS